MDTMMDRWAELGEFLLARFAEDEAVAQAAKEDAETPWRATYGRQVETARAGYLVTPEDEHSYTTDPPEGVAVHIARHDPDRVLAECEAKRRVVTLAWAYSEGEASERTMNLAADVMRILALPYADHPDYREEWRP